MSSPTRNAHFGRRQMGGIDMLEPGLGETEYHSARIYRLAGRIASPTCMPGEIELARRPRTPPQA